MHALSSAVSLGKAMASRIQLTSVRTYGSRVRNILRNRYFYRNKDGSYKEYNEAITVLPKEFAHQDEYKDEKRLSEYYKQRYEHHSKQKAHKYSLQLPKPKEVAAHERTPAQLNTELLCQHPDDEDNDTNGNNNDDDDEANSKPVRLPVGDPYKMPMRQCIFCKHNVPLDYKNVQLLSQFMSPYTGIVYNQQVTGLCHWKQTEVERTIAKSKMLGFMPFFYKETTFVTDPRLFDPLKNNLRSIPNSFDKRKLTADE